MQKHIGENGQRYFESIVSDMYHAMAQYTQYYVVWVANGAKNNRKTMQNKNHIFIQSKYSHLKKKTMQFDDIFDVSSIFSI